MHNRRIVTGHDKNGKSVFVSDGLAPRAHAFEHVPGFFASMVWATAAGTQVPSAGDPTVASRSWVPEPGGSSLQLVRFPPDAVMGSPSFDPQAAGGEIGANLSGLAEKFEVDAPGMHTTDSVDYGVLLDGEIWLELDDGQAKCLKPHDIVVQNGTRHAWRNRSDRPATMLFVLLGANRI